MRFSRSSKSRNDVRFVPSLLVFVSRFCTGREISRFRYIKTWGRKIAIEVFFCLFFAILIFTLGRFNQAKKESVIYTLNGKITLNWAGHCNY